MNLRFYMILLSLGVDSIDMDHDVFLIYAGSMIEDFSNESWTNSEYGRNE